MSYTHRLISCFLAVLLLSSCGKMAIATTETPQKNNETISETTAETVDPNAENDLPEDLSFGGADFQMLSPNEYDGISMVEELTGELLNDAKYQMELDTEERLNILFTEVPSDFWSMSETVANICMSGDSTYSSIVMMDRFAISCAKSGYFIPLQNTEYINLNKLYWGGVLSDLLSVSGNKFFGIGAFNLRSYSLTSCIYYNKDLGNDLGCTTSPMEDVYDGSWTLDKFKSYENIATIDLNGDNVMDDNDQYTYGSQDIRSLAAQFWLACDISTMDKDSEDIPYCALYGNEKFYNVMEYIHNLLFSTPNRFDTSLKPEYEYHTYELFVAGRELFSISNFSQITQDIRKMEDDFTVLPMPKYDENQKQYISRTYDSMFCMIPVPVVDASMSSAVLEYLSYTAYKHLIPAYLEDSLQQKYSRDQDAVYSINLIFNNRRIDVGEIIAFDILGDFAMYNLLNSNAMNIASFFEEKKNNIDKAIEEYIQIIN